MGLISRVSSRTYRFRPPSSNMVCVKDVNQTDFVYALAEFFKKQGRMQIPKWTDFGKTASAKLMGPDSDDWFYVRTASIARQLYVKGTIGVGTFSKIYGCKVNRGTRPGHYRKGNGHVARFALQELEKMKFRVQAEKGRKKVNKRSTESPTLSTLHRFDGCIIYADNFP